MNKPIPAAPALPDVAEGEKQLTLVCSHHTHFVGICTECVAANFNRNRFRPEHQSRAGAGEQRGAIDEALNELKLLALDKDYRADSFTLQPLRNALLGAGEQRGDTPADKVRAVWEKVTRHKPQEAQPLPAESSRDELMEEIARLNRVCKVQYRLERTLRKERDEAEAELSRLSSPVFKSFSHMIGEILDCIDMAPNDDPIPYIRKYVNGLRKSHLTDLRKD